MTLSLKARSLTLKATYYTWTVEKHLCENKKTKTKTAKLEKLRLLSNIYLPLNFPLIFLDTASFCSSDLYDFCKVISPLHNSCSEICYIKNYFISFGFWTKTMK